jgi:tripartite-type tricarboxylate transporter receptor subunit TctC
LAFTLDQQVGFDDALEAVLAPRFDDLGATPRGTTPGELAAFLKSEIDKWGPVIRDARIRVEN